MRLVYQIGLEFDEDDAEVKAQFEELAALPDSDPIRHELFAGLLLMAMRLEHRDADFWRGEHRRLERLAERRAARKAAKES